MRTTLLRSLPKIVRDIGFTLGCLLVSSTSSASDVYIPNELEPWKDWVLANTPDIDCPISNKRGSRTSCVWLKGVQIDLSTEQKRLDFRMEGTAYADSRLQLPSGDNRPVDVTVNGDVARVGEVKGNSRVYLDKGDFQINGRIELDTIPRTIQLPRVVAIVELSVDGESIAAPRLEKGQLWLRPQRGTTQASDALSIDVFRQLTDSIPQVLETRVRLTVDGRDRIESLGYPIFEGFAANQVVTKLPVQVTDDGEFKVQLSRGIHWVTVVSRSNRIMNKFNLVAGSERWPKAEIWALVSDSDHRSVDVEGAEAIDPMLVESPFGAVPTFRAMIDSTLTLTNEKRGDLNPKPPTYSVERELWLSFDGDTLVSVDNISSNVSAETRLSASYELGTVLIDGAPRVITDLNTEAGSKPGIVLSPSNYSVHSVGTIQTGSVITANGWDMNVDALTASLNVPPGWKLLWTTGVDQVRGAWLSGWWNLWDIFICVLIVIVLYRVAGLPVAVITAVAVVLAYQDHQVPAIGWLLLGLVLLLDRFIKSSRLRRVNEVVFWLLMVPVAVASVYVAANNIRQAIYPQLDSIFSQPFVYGGVENRITQSAEHRPLIREAARDQVQELEVSANFGQFLESPQPLPDVASESTENLADSYVARAVQTGPGKPTWHWDRAVLSWSGPVSANQTIGLTFSPPWLTRTLYVLIAALHLVMLVLFVILRMPGLNGFPPWLKKLMPAFLLSLVATSSQAEFPDEALLTELRNRLTESPICVPGCASIEEASFEMSQSNSVTLQLKYLSDAEIAVELPTSEPNTALRSVNLAGRKAPVLGDPNGAANLKLSQGSNLVTLLYDLTEVDDLVVDLPLNAARVTADLCCADMSRSVDVKHQRFVLRRVSKTENEETLEATAYEFARPIEVHREISLDYEPSIVTTVAASSPLTSALPVQISLLPNETVLSDQITVQDGQVLVTLSRGQPRAVWQSSLELTDGMTLTAPESSQVAEVWYVRSSEFWHVEAEGLTPSKSARNATVFRPYHGESVRLSFSQPTPVAGQTRTVKRVHVVNDVGQREAISTAHLTIEASVASKLDFSLPDNAVIEALIIDREERVLDQGAVVEVPILNGEHQYEIRWRNEEAMAPFYRTPLVSMSEPARNVTQIVEVPRNRWILLLGGPAMGSAVLFWGVVLVTLLLALALTVLPRFPLSKVDAGLLAVGATLANIWALLFVALWIIGIWWRAKNTLEDLSSVWYGLTNVVLVVLSVVGLLALFITVLSALQTPPDMFITASPLIHGAGAFTSQGTQHLMWFSDVSVDALPTAWVFSLPFWVYQLAMLGWSLWLVFALTRWVRFTFATLSAQPFWPTKKKASGKQVEEQEQLADASQDDASNATSDQD